MTGDENHERLLCKVEMEKYFISLVFMKVRS
jgi:hypothetical protein